MSRFKKKKKSQMYRNKTGSRMKEVSKASLLIRISKNLNALNLSRLSLREDMHKTNNYTTNVLPELLVINPQ